MAEQRAASIACGHPDVKASLLQLPTRTWANVCEQRRLRASQRPSTRSSSSASLCASSARPERLTRNTAPPPEEDCSLCLETLTNTSVLRVLPCQHFFHKSCLDDYSGDRLGSRERCYFSSVADATQFHRMWVGP